MTEALVDDGASAAGTDVREDGAVEADGAGWCPFCWSKRGEARAATPRDVRRAPPRPDGVAWRPEPRRERAEPGMRVKRPGCAGAGTLAASSSSSSPSLAPALPACVSSATRLNIVARKLPRILESWAANRRERCLRLADAPPDPPTPGAGGGCRPSSAVGVLCRAEGVPAWLGGRLGGERPPRGGDQGCVDGWPRPVTREGPPRRPLGGREAAPYVDATGAAEEDAAAAASMRPERPLLAWPFVDGKGGRANAP